MKYTYTSNLKKLCLLFQTLMLCCLGFFANAETHADYSHLPASDANEAEALLACDARTILAYNLDACESFSSNGSNRDFSEFTPRFPNRADCSSVNATGVFRTGGDHSCVAGANGSPGAICVPAEGGNSFRPDDDDAVRFEVTVNSGSTGRLTELRFFQLAPRNFLHLSGRSGSNDYPQRFGVRVLKNGSEIFRRTGLSTAQNDWELEIFNFEGNNDFQFSGTARFSFEILGYAPVGNRGEGDFFDVDEIEVKAVCGSCDPCANQGGDSDGDGICDNQDNCDFNANPNQADSDGDGIGDACDSTPNGNPCANQGGDSDGDGICDNQDNCDFNFNPDQADNDGDGIGNVCDNTPNGGGSGGGGGSCNDVTVRGEAGKVTIENIPSGAVVEILGPSTGFAIQEVCNGNCNSMEMVNNLAAGNYDVKIQTFNPYCFRQVNVEVTGGGGGGSTNPCANQGGDSDGDGICDNQDNCDFNFNPDQADNDGDGIGNVCDSTPNGGGSTGGGGGSCNDVNVSGGSGRVTITDIPSAALVEILGPSTGYGVQTVCNGNCSGTETVNNLAAGTYSVKIQTYSPYCFRQVDVQVTGGGGSTNPCANQGGDSDGDGICDNQDNCDFTSNPDQADNDGDGIGNVCDSTPNGGGTGGGGGGTCNDVNVSGGDGSVTIRNIPSSAVVEILGPSTGYAIQGLSLIHISEPTRPY